MYSAKASVKTKKAHAQALNVLCIKANGLLNEENRF
jgi:hypothetical protein